MADLGEIRELLELELSEQINPKGIYPVLDDEGVPMRDRVGLTKADVLIKQIIHKAIRGDNKAMQEVLDRIYGKAQQTIQHNVSKTYVNFLEDIAEAEDADFVELPPPPPEDGIDNLKDSGLL